MYLQLCDLKSPAVRQLVHEEGVVGMYSGVLPALLLCTNPAIQGLKGAGLAKRIFVG